MKDFKPLLADDAVLESLRFPVYASPKLDGVRATFINGRLMTRSLKPIPNRRVNEVFKLDHPLDGELIVGKAYSKTVFRDTMKVVSAHDAPIDNLNFRVFDYVCEGGFGTRLQRAMLWCDFDKLLPVPHILISDLDTLMAYEKQMTEQGYEGVMLRDPDGKYKYGRSTVSEGILLKLKRKNTAEARCIGFEERMHNANEAKTNALGYAERSSHKANKVPMNTMGALICRDLKSGVEFNVGTGFSDAERHHIWTHQSTFLDKILTYEYLAVGVKDKPRHPAFKGWRAPEDM